MWHTPGLITWCVVKTRRLAPVVLFAEAAVVDETAADEAGGDPLEKEGHDPEQAIAHLRIFRGGKQRQKEGVV